MTSEYRALVAKVEVFTRATSERRAADLACSAGCSSCCEAWLSVSAVEADELRRALARLSSEERNHIRTRAERELTREASGERAARCALLDEAGRCSVYEARPLVCRTQGHALRYPAGFIPRDAIKRRTARGDVTWCPLNYGEKPPLAEDILEAERVDEILAVVARRHASTRGMALDHRLRLSVLAAEGDVLSDEPALARESERTRSQIE